MALLGNIAAALAAVPAAAVEALAERRRLKSAERIRTAELEAEAHRLKLDAWRADAELAAAWERATLERAGWKDEYWTLVLSAPLVLCFFPATAPAVLAGFGVLELTPEWYRYSVGVAIGAAFGLRPVVNLFRRSAAA